MPTKAYYMLMEVGLDKFFVANLTFLYYFVKEPKLKRQ